MRLKDPPPSRASLSLILFLESIARHLFVNLLCESKEISTKKIQKNKGKHATMDAIQNATLGELMRQKRAKHQQYLQEYAKKINPTQEKFDAWFLATFMSHLEKIDVRTHYEVSLFMEARVPGQYVQRVKPDVLKTWITELENKHGVTITYTNTSPCLPMSCSCGWDVNCNACANGRIAVSERNIDK